MASTVCTAAPLLPTPAAASTVCTAAPLLPTPAAASLLPTRAAAPLLRTPANKKAGRASTSVSWIRDKIERASPAFQGHALQTNGKNPLRPSSSTCRGRASLSKNWTDDKIGRASTGFAGQALQTQSKNCSAPPPRFADVRPCPTEIEGAGIGCKRSSAAGSEIQRNKIHPGPTFSNSPDPSKNWTEIEGAGIGCKSSSATRYEIQRREEKHHSAAAYYAGPAFSNSPHPSELSTPFFVRSPDPSQV